MISGDLVWISTTRWVRSVTSRSGIFSTPHYLILSSGSPWCAGVVRVGHWVQKWEIALLLAWFADVWGSDLILLVRSPTPINFTCTLTPILISTLKSTVCGWIQLTVSLAAAAWLWIRVWFVISLIELFCWIQLEVVLLRITAATILVISTIRFTLNSIHSILQTAKSTAVITSIIIHFEQIIAIDSHFEFVILAKTTCTTLILTSTSHLTRKMFI